jgi:hypothetical protein
MKHWQKITNHRGEKKKKTDGRIFMALIPVSAVNRTMMSTLFHFGEGLWSVGHVDPVFGLTGMRAMKIRPSVFFFFSPL